MYIKDDICYAGELSDNIKVAEVKPLHGAWCSSRFRQKKRLFDTTKLQGAAFKTLSDEQIFAHPALFHGVITWNNGEIDIAPETVYRESLTYDEGATCNDDLWRVS